MCVWRGSGGAGLLATSIPFFIHNLFCVATPVVAAVVRAAVSCSIGILQHYTGGSRCRKKWLYQYCSEGPSDKRKLPFETNVNEGFSF